MKKNPRPKKVKNKTPKIPTLSLNQIAFAFHKYIHGERPINGKTNHKFFDWNKLDEEAYKAVKIGIFNEGK